MTIQDYKDLHIDSKYNYIMVGVAIGLISQVDVSIWYLLSITAGVLFFNWAGRRTKFFGKGDYSAFNWLFLGLGLINPVILLAYIIWIILLGVIYQVCRKLFTGLTVKVGRGKIRIKRISGISKPVPFYPVIFGAWILTVPLLLL